MRKEVYQLIVLDEYGGVGLKTMEKYSSVKELKRIIDGRNIVKLNLQDSGFWMIFDYDGGFKIKKYNSRASELCRHQIFGPAVILKIWQRSQAMKIPTLSTIRCLRISAAAKIDRR